MQQKSTKHSGTDADFPGTDAALNFIKISFLGFSLTIVGYIV